LSADQVRSLIEDRQSKTTALLEKSLPNQPAQRLALETINSTLAERLLRAVNLSKTQSPTSLSLESLLHDVKRPTNINEHADAMKQIIREETSGSSTAFLRQKALTIIKEYLDKQTEKTGGSVDLPLGGIYSLQSDVPVDDPEKVSLTLLATEAAKAIGEWVAENMTYMSDPPGDFLQPPLQTLEVAKGGDCDDLTILTCSLWRSVGLKTFLAYMEGHVLAGVNLRYPEEVSGAYLLRDLEVPFDPTSRIPFGDTQVLERELQSKLGLSLKQAKIFYVET